MPRRSLQGLLLVVDARRGLSSGDWQLIEWAGAHECAVHVLLSKCDQLRRNEARLLLERTRSDLGGLCSIPMRY